MLETRSIVNDDGHISLRDEAAAQDLHGQVSLRDLLAAAHPHVGQVHLGLGSWQNWLGDLGAGTLRSQPRHRDDVRAVIEWAVDNDMTVRAVGAGHSSSRAAQPDDVHLDMSDMSGARPARWLRDDVDHDHLVTVAAGTRVKVLNRVLLPRLASDHGMDLALPNMGSFDWQTVAGALCTGTHGSGQSLGPMADAVRSIDLVVVEEPDQVRAVRLEPTDGVTDLRTFEAATSEHGMTLVQDDDLFFASVVAFGATGIITAMTLELVDAFWLEEHNAAMRWDRVRGLLANVDDDGLPRVLGVNRHWEFYVNAADMQRGRPQDPLCLVRARNPVPSQPRPDDWDRPWPPRRPQGRMFQGIDVDDNLQRRGEGNVLTGRGPIRWSLANAIQANFRRSADQPPFVGGRSRSRSDLVLRRERDDRAPDEEPRAPPRAISNELAVPIEHTAAAVDRLLQVMATNDHYYVVPFGVRFTAASPHVLAPQHGRSVAMIEVPLKTNTGAFRRDARVLAASKDALAELEDELCHDADHLDGHPHWGQYHRLDRARLERLYGDDVARFERAVRRFNATGTFDNSHLRQLGLA